MIAKEKAEELFAKMFHVKDDLHKYPMCLDTAKECAIIAVDLVIENIEDDYFEKELNYWKEVKHKIEKL